MKNSGNWFQNLLQKTRTGMNRFMQGRYGADQFTVFLCKAALVLMLLSWIDFLSFFYVWGILCIGYSLFRMLSRNFVKRRAENSAYLQLNYKFQTAFAGWKARMKSRGEYKYFRCKKCRKLLRVPRGRGKLNVTCPQCGHKMIQKS